MELKYLDKTDTEWIIPHVTLFQVARTQAHKRAQFAPVALPPKPAGQGGQNEYLFLSGDDLALYRTLNPSYPVRQWLWGHDRSGWIAWAEPKEAQRIERENKKRKRRDWIPLHEARMICWPAIALMGNGIYIDDIQPTKKGEYGHVVGIPAAADLSLVNQETYPGWIHTAKNPGGGVILKDGQPAYMPLFAREGRKGKARGSLWIAMEYLEKVAE